MNIPKKAYARCLLNKKSKCYKLISSDLYILKYCEKINDNKKMRSMLSSQYGYYYYCRFINNRVELYTKITDSYWARLYCRDVDDVDVVRKYITEKEDIDRYNEFGEI